MGRGCSAGKQKKRACEVAMRCFGLGFESTSGGGDRASSKGARAQARHTSTSTSANCRATRWEGKASYGEECGTVLLRYRLYFLLCIPAAFEIQ